MLCKNSSKNITLTKAQIISYFTELHKLNTTFIQNYIDSINKNDGIRANILHDKLYDELLDKGLLQKDMFQWYSNAPKAASPQAKLLALDYFKKTNQYNFTIVFFDELFYAYLVWSLGEFTIPYYSGYIAEQKNMPFNLGAYIDDRKLIDGGYLQYKIGRYFYEHYIDILTPEVRRDYELFCIDAYSHSAYYNEGSFEIDPSYYIPTDEAGHYNKEGSGFAFQSPNLDFFGDMTIKPSPLGNYYFELEDNENTFVEYYQRIYPKLDNPPKGWSKEMMQKLELKLE